jgi:hypothetical protein
LPGGAQLHIIGLANITLGDNVRIDGFSSLIAPNGRIRIGSFVHIATACMLGARGGIEIGDFSSLSQASACSRRSTTFPARSSATRWRRKT